VAVAAVEIAALWLDATEVPTELVAFTVKVKLVEELSPVMVQVVPEDEQVRPLDAVAT